MTPPEIGRPQPARRSLHRDQRNASDPPRHVPRKAISCPPAVEWPKHFGEQGRWVRFRVGDNHSGPRARLPVMRELKTSFPDHKGNLPDRPIKFPARPEKTPCYDA